LIPSRQGELAALRWEDIDLTGKPFITARRSADTRTKTRASTTRTNKERKILIGISTVDAFFGTDSQRAILRSSILLGRNKGL
jgi:integrase